MVIVQIIRKSRLLRNHYIVGEGIDLPRYLLQFSGFRRPKPRLAAARHRHSGNLGLEYRAAEKAVALFLRNNQRIFHIYKKRFL